MLVTYVKLVFRKLVRNWVYSVINIVGFVIAFTVSLLICSHVVKEGKTDSFHVGGDRIYRVTSQIPGNSFWTTEFCSPMGEYAKAEIPGVREYVRLVAPQTLLVKKESEGEFLPESRCVYSDPQFFSVLSFPLVAGQIDPAVAPAWAVISERMAAKYFGEELAVGKTLTLRLPDSPEDMEYKVVAVMADFPAYSSLQADILLDFKQIESTYVYGAGNALTTLLQLESQADIAAIEKEIPEMEGRHDDYQKQLGKVVRLQSLGDIYLHSQHIRDYEDVFAYGSLRFNYILGGIALLILLLASCNYFMIKTAQLQQNGAMFAVQRCFGAGNCALGRQVYLEIGIYVLSALGIAVWMFFILHPYFVEVVSPQNLYTFTFSAGEWFSFVVFILVFTGLVGYALIVWMLKRLDRSGIKQTIQRTARGFDLKQGLLIVQMCIFCGLLFASVVLVKQMNYVHNKPMGYDNRNVLCVEWPVGGEMMLSARDELLRNPDILAVTNGRPLPIGNWRTYEVYVDGNPEMKVKASALLGDTDYVSAYSMHLLEGRNYRQNGQGVAQGNGAGVPGEAVINQCMVKELGLQHPVGTVLNYGPSTVTIVGVVEDFHYESLYRPVKPVMIGAHLPGFETNLSIRYREGKRQAVLDYLQQYYKDNYMGILLQYTEYSYSALYARDMALVKMVNVLTILAILISAMGILAFSMFITECRQKEIALRKINGATEYQVIGLLNRSFVIKMLFACVLGIPFAWYFMEHWLTGFAYRATLDWWIFAGDVVVSVLLIMLVAAWQTWRAASANPVKTLKSE